MRGKDTKFGFVSVCEEQEMDPVTYCAGIVANFLLLDKNKTDRTLPRK